MEIDEELGEYLNMGVSEFSVRWSERFGRDGMSDIRIRIPNFVVFFPSLVALILGMLWIHISNRISGSLSALECQNSLHSTHSLRLQNEIEVDLLTILAVITERFNADEIQYWISPGAALLSLEMKDKNGDDNGIQLELSPFHDGLDLSVLTQDSTRILMILGTLFEFGIEVVETHYGLRIFHQSGIVNVLTDYKIPFLDIMFMKQLELKESVGGNVANRNQILVNDCCTCDRSSVSICNKKLCTCRICWFYENEIFPLRNAFLNRQNSIHISIPHNISLILLPNYDQDQTMNSNFHMIDLV
uniref:Uncharacterized protein n=1 Tax=Timspurckia oligopyrenoides TaxID=708627 RepID=A0A6T6PAF6_9RHOD|mmetsp:Transcript_9726/g.17542  ORF Transcript_9726/g.17542 Transcript_9726/m.17542 type:complete len:302 (+) Transcript_9726:1035-1940(+)